MRTRRRQYQTLDVRCDLVDLVFVTHKRDIEIGRHHNTQIGEVLFRPQTQHASRVGAHRLLSSPGRDVTGREDAEQPQRLRATRHDLVALARWYVDTLTCFGGYQTFVAVQDSATFEQIDELANFIVDVKWTSVRSREFGIDFDDSDGHACPRSRAVDELGSGPATQLESRRGFRANQMGH